MRSYCYRTREFPLFATKFNAVKLLENYKPKPVSFINFCVVADKGVDLFVRIKHFYQNSKFFVCYYM